VSWHLSKDLVDWAQVLGAVFSLVALSVAAVALVGAKRDLGRERRTAYDLEVLRELSNVVEGFGVQQAVRARSLLLLLSGSADLPMVRAAVDARSSDAATREFTTRYPDAPALPTPTNENRNGASERYRRLRFVNEDNTSRTELDQAIKRRLG
jgi:hypothetical protein